MTRGASIVAVEAAAVLGDWQRKTRIAAGLGRERKGESRGKRGGGGGAHRAPFIGLGEDRGERTERRATTGFVRSSRVLGIPCGLEGKRREEQGR